MSLGSFFDLAGADLLILVMLVAPIAVVVVPVRIGTLSRQAPPPLPKPPKATE